MVALLEDSSRQLHAAQQNQALMTESPMEVQAAMESAARSIGTALRWLKSSTPDHEPWAPLPGGPTRQQGQFLAFIHQYILRNYSGIAPSHANLQRFFDLSAPSVNSMLVRLEQRGFIRRIHGKARAIEVVCPPNFIPPLDRPFKF